MQVWGGLECTVNRVGERYFSQLDGRRYATGVEDIERFAALGLRAMRFPVLWERVAPAGLHAADWSWTDVRLARLRALDLPSIAGLLHHGSGPRDTSLVDPGFPEKLAAYAAAVAARYPWIGHYTPVNEPLTTARFSGLYGVWYPHGRDPATFWRALSNQCRGVVLAMRAVERIRPDAKLVQTDDLGTTYSTAALAYQAEFNNEMRWLAWDLLCGRVDREHTLWGWLTSCCGASARDILWFRDNPRPPDIIGIDHYITSDRFLDDDLDRHAPIHHGGNGRHRYADIEAVRVRAEPCDGVGPLLAQAWARYRLPLAITEAHIDTGREGQLRWLAEIWAGARHARDGGADVRAVTTWAMLGAHDWNCLLTECRGHYESGAFDVSGGRARPTAITALVRQLAAGEPPRHPALAGEGWWRRPGRHCVAPAATSPFRGEPNRAGPDRAEPYRAAPDRAEPNRAEPNWAERNQAKRNRRKPEHAEPHQDAGQCSRAGAVPAVGTARGACAAIAPAAPRAALQRAPILIVGAGGTLGSAFARICAERDLEHRLVGHGELDIADADAVARAIGHHHPWAVINAAGYVRVDEAEHDPERCFRDNALGAATLARICARQRIGLVTFSTDLVFDGRQQSPYRETDPPAPLNVYGQSKARAEALVLEHHPDALVVRTSAFFGPWDASNFITRALRALNRSQPFLAARDTTVSPTYVPDLVHACLDLLIDRERGIWHLSNDRALTWAEFARHAARAAGIDTRTLRPCTRDALRLAARRPRYSALGSSRGVIMPSLDDALGRYLRQGSWH